MPAVRSTRSKTFKSPPKPATKSAKALKSKPQQKGNLAAPPKDNEDDLDPNESSSDDGGDVCEESASVEEDGDEDDDLKSMDSDALDDDELSSKSRKRKRASPAKKTHSKKQSPKKKKKDNDDEFEDDFELQEGQEVVGTVVQAPKTGRGVPLGQPLGSSGLTYVNYLVPAGQISNNTFNFLTQLENPKCNDREWFVFLRRLLLLPQLT